MIEDAPTMEAEGAMVLDGLAVGVDHLEAIVVYFAEVGHLYASWKRKGLELSPARVASGFVGLADVSSRVGPALLGDAEGRLDSPVFTFETSRHTTFIHRVRSFGVAIVFEREAPLGFARMAARNIVRTLDQELPYPREPAPVALPEARATAPSGPPAPPDMQFEAHEPAPDTQHQARNPLGDRVRALIRHVETNARDAHLARARLALRSGLGLDAVGHPEALNADALLVLETAAEDILGLEPGTLTEVMQP